MVLQDARLQMMAQQDPQAMQVLVNNMIAQKSSRAHCTTPNKWRLK
jgi:hypothetical protein